MKIEMITESGKRVKVYHSADGYIIMVESWMARDNLDSFDVREFKPCLRPGTVFMRGMAWEFHATWSISECNRLGIHMPR